LELFLNPLQFVYLFCNLSQCILLFFSGTASLNHKCAKQNVEVTVMDILIILFLDLTGVQNIQYRTITGILGIQSAFILFMNVVWFYRVVLKC
jgi:hypothetical protein